MFIYLRENAGYVQNCRGSDCALDCALDCVLIVLKIVLPLCFRRAVDVTELRATDSQALPARSELRPLEVRRFAAATPGPGSMVHMSYVCVRWVATGAVECRCP